LPIKNRQGSNERFISVANLLARYSNQLPITYSFQVLDTVKQEDTRWSLVYDIKNLTVSFKFHSCNTIKVFDFKELGLLESVSSLGGDLSNCNFINNDGLNTVTSEENTQLIRNVFSLLSQEIEADIDYNLLYQMAILGNQNLKQSVPTKLVDEFNQCIHNLPNSSSLNYPDKVFDKITDWKKYSVIALGEATHGTKEFFELKHRLLKYLVEKHDIKALAYEFSFRKSLKINDYLINGIGNIDSLLSSEYWIQNNVEVKNMFYWMRSYNQYKKPEDKIHFVGIDNQGDAHYSKEVIKYLEKHYPSFIKTNKKLVTQINQLDKISYRKISQKKFLFRNDLFKELA